MGRATHFVRAFDDGLSNVVVVAPFKDDQTDNGIFSVGDIVRFHKL